MLIRCEKCQDVLGDRVENGVLIRKENHKEIFLENILKVTCGCGFENFIKTKGES